MFKYMDQGLNHTSDKFGFNLAAYSVKVFNLDISVTCILVQHMPN